jgi:hypothetical protein
MTFRRQRVRIAKSRASKMWMESLEQRQLLAPIAGDPSFVGAGLAGNQAQRLDETTSPGASWVADNPREVTTTRRDDGHQPGMDGVVVMVL